MRCISGDDIPFLLKQIPQPPKQLWVEGFLADDATSSTDETKYLCVVGSRKHSTYGREACEHLISGLAGYNICIVSGLALGIDSIAHEAALSAGLRTLAFPGSGLDRIVLYPGSRHTLARRIIEAGGALLSEFDPLQRSDIWTFPQRNRLMAGMSHATLIIEAAEDSGTLITARLALDYNRDVLALPGSIFSPLSHGPHLQIHYGATIARSSADILEALHIEPRIEGPSGGQTDHLPEDKVDELTDIEKEIIEAIFTEPTSRDELSEILSIDIATLNIHLTLLELKNIINIRDSIVSLRC